MKRAIDVWWRHAEAPGPQRAVARHNLAVIGHLFLLNFERSQLNGTAEQERAGAERIAAAEADWQSTMRFWAQVIDDGDVWTIVSSRIKEIDDPSLTTGASRRLRLSLAGALTLINARLALRAIELGETDAAERQVRQTRNPSFPQEGVAEGLNRVVEPLRVQVTALAEAAKRDAASGPDTADKTMEKFLEQAARLLKPIDLLLDEDHPARHAAHDEVALTALSCAIDYANKTGDWARAAVLLNALTPFALGAAAKERIVFNLATVNGNLEEGRCEVCKKNPGEEKAAIEVKMFGDVQRTPQYGSVRVTWRSLTLKVPRCEECKKKYGRSVSRSFLRFSLIGILGVVLLEFTNQHFRYGSGEDSE